MKTEVLNKILFAQRLWLFVSENKGVGLKSVGEKTGELVFVLRNCEIPWEFFLRLIQSYFDKGVVEFWRGSLVVLGVCWSRRRVSRQVRSRGKLSTEYWTLEVCMELSDQGSWTKHHFFNTEELLKGTRKNWFAHKQGHTWTGGKKSCDYHTWDSNDPAEIGYSGRYF